MVMGSFSRTPRAMRNWLQSAEKILGKYARQGLGRDNSVTGLVGNLKLWLP